MSKDTAALFLPGLNSSQQLVARRLFQLRLDEPMSPLQCESFFFRVLRLCSKAKPDAKDSKSNSERVNHGVVKGVEESKLENFPTSNLRALFLTCEKGVSITQSFCDFFVASVFAQ